MGNGKDKSILAAATKLRRRAEKVLKARVSETGLPPKDAETLRLLHELQVHQIELEMQNAELRQSRDEMETSLERYTDLYDFAPVGYCTLDREGTIQVANLTAAGLLGIERSRLTGRRFVTFVVAENRPFFSAFIGTVFAGQGKAFCELMLTTGGDSRIHVRIEATTCSVGRECRMVFSDISEQKRLEERAVHLSSFPQLNPNPILELDSTGRISYFNPATVKALESLGMVELDMAVFLPPDLNGIMESWDRSSEVTFNREIPIKDKTFRESIFLTPRFQTARIYSYDITERKQAEDRIALLAETASLLFAIESPREVIKTLCIKAMTVLDCHAFFNFLLDEETGRLRLNASAGIPEEELRKIEWLDTCTTISDCAARNASRNNRDTPDPHQTELVRSYDIMSSACYPMLTHDRALGTLSFVSSKNRFSDDDLSLMKALADQIAIALERSQNAKALKTSHDKLEQRVAERTSELADTVNVLQVEIVEREKVEQSLIQAEENVRKLNRLYLTLSETGKAIARLLDRDELFREFCRIAVECGGFRMVWVGLLDNETGLVKPVASFGPSTDYLEAVRISALREPEGMGPTGTVIRSGGHYICNDFVADPATAPWHLEAQKRGFLASAAFAFSQGGVIIGAITMYADETGYFDPEKVELLLQMQADITFALDNLEREARQRETERALQSEIMERLNVVEELRNKEQMLLQQNRLAAMGEMINNIAHQWRQPLNVLGLLIQQMQMFYENGSFNKEYVDASVSKSMKLINHMSQTIDDFRNFYKPDKEKVRFVIHEVVARTLSLVEDGLTNQQIRVEVHASNNPVIIGFPNEFSQALLNILLNARDALLERRPVEARITVTISKEGEGAVVTVADNAGGIAEDIMGKIFDPYYTTKGPQQGTGVGLFMSKAIIENNMGGRLTVRNIAHGAEFRIEL